MNYGKSAYIKVLELERKYGDWSKVISANNDNFYENKIAGSYTLSSELVLLAFEVIQNGYVIVQALFDAATIIGGSMNCGFLINGENIYGEVKQLSGTNCVSVALSKKLHVSAGDKIYFYANSLLNDITISNVSFFLLGGEVSSSFSSGQKRDLQIIPTNNNTYIMSYIDNNQVMAGEAGGSFEFTFYSIISAISHSFCFDKNGNLLLFYVDNAHKLYLKIIGSTSNDVCIAQSVVCVSSAISPVGDSSLAIASYTTENGKAYYAVIDENYMSYSRELVFRNYEFVKTFAVTTGDFSYIVLTSKDNNNYLFKSAYSPLGERIYDSLVASGEIIATKYYLAGDLASNAVDAISVAVNITTETVYNYARLIDEQCISHLAFSGECLQETYTVESNAISYCVVIDKTISDPTLNCSYALDAAGFTPLSVVGNGGTVYGSFDTYSPNSWADAWPFNEIRPCALNNGQFVGYIKPDDFTKFLDGTNVGSESESNFLDVMIEIPKIYYKIVTQNDKIYIYISNQKVDNDYVCYAHTYDGVEVNKIYISAYDNCAKTFNGGLTLFSSSGSRPKWWNNRSTYFDHSTFLDNKATGYRHMSFDQMTLLQCLAVLLTKSTNMQGVFGLGITAGSPQNSGSCNDKGMYAGSLTSAYSAVKMFGIENIYGNVYNRVQELVIISSATSEYSLFKRYATSNVTINKLGTGYTEIKNHTLDYENASNVYLVNPYGTTDLGFLPQEKISNGSSSTFFADTVDFAPHYDILFGGDCSSGDKAGMFSIHGDPNRVVSGYRNGFKIVYYAIGGN